MTDTEQQAQLEADLAEAKAKIVEMETKIAGFVEELEKKEKTVSHAESKFNEMAQETGDNRKAVAAAATDALEAVKAEKEASKMLREAQDALAEMKSTLGPKEEDKKNRESQKAKTAEEIEAGLSDAENATLDEAWKVAAEATKARVKTDPDFKKKFLLKAQTATRVAVESDLSDWRSSPAGKPSESRDDGLDELFKLKKQRAESYPDGHTSGQRGGRTKPAVSTRPPQKVVKKDWGIAE